MTPAYMTEYGPIEYEPPMNLCSLARYNVAQCARLRMAQAHKDGESELWKGERITFWSTLSAALPYSFK